ncbi:MAG: hypothetical protein ACREGE_02795 [Candidatus Microsaccharimonas sp.]
MSNFDFDELDKAVADALGTNESSVSFSDNAADFVNEGSETSKSKTLSAIEVEPTPTASEQKPMPAPAAPLASRRSSGRFMDVVHPSSDMRTASASRAAFTPPAPKPAEPTDTTDVLDTKDDFENISDLGWSKPVESPFLPDAKVEKRPLGAEVPTGPANAAPEEEDLLLEAPDDPRLEALNMPDPIDFAAQSSVLATETEDTGAFDVAAVEEPVLPKVLETPEISETPAPMTPVSAAPVAEPSGPASITQQYEEKQSTQQESGAIYDTENYHQPVIDTTSKPHGAWTILWIILLVILGAGAGVAFYLFVLPML